MLFVKLVVFNNIPHKSVKKIVSVLAALKFNFERRRNMIKKTILIFAVLAALLISTQVAFAAERKVKEQGNSAANESKTMYKAKSYAYPGGGTWNYGSSIYYNKKYVWSYYYNSLSYHSSASQIGRAGQKGYRFSQSGITAPKKWSYSSVSGPKNYQGYAYWYTYY